jgi:hypothetical protein
MRPFTLLLTLLASTATTVSLGACEEGELDCTQLCEQGQEKNCTAITGDCGDFCDALTGVQDESSCTDERESYSECLNGEGVCSGDCDVDEAALRNCVTAYCATHATEPDCVALVASYQ